MQFATAAINNNQSKNQCLQSRCSEWTCSPSLQFLSSATTPTQHTQDHCEYSTHKSPFSFWHYGYSTYV